MTGMGFVSDMRSAGNAPGLVVIELCRTATVKPSWLAGPPSPWTVNVVIGAADELSAIDFRALHGLTVILHDDVGDEIRYRRVSRRIVEVKPRRLIATGGTAIHTWPTPITTPKELTP